jgi:hypothetical protein
MTQDKTHHKFTISLWGMHLANAMEQFARAREMDTKRETTLFNSTLVLRTAMSSILHSFCALEAFLDQFASELFRNELSGVYLAQHQRNDKLQALNKYWQQTRILEKFESLLNEFRPDIDHTQWKHSLTELNQLRNWIAHGKSYIETVELTTEIEEGLVTSTGEHVSSNIDWELKFPFTRYNKVDELDSQDALKTLSIVITAIQVFLDQTSTKGFFIGITGNKKFNVVFLKADSNVEEILRKIGCL